jgi:hypothetical protein
MKNNTEKKSVEIQPEQIEKLENLYFELSCALKSSSFRPRFALYTGAEKVEVIKKYIRALEILDIRMPEIDPLISDLLKSDLRPGRNNIWAQASDRVKTD